MPAILDWRQAAAPDDLARQLSQALTAGSVVALPSEAGVLTIGYAEAGPADGPVVILLHGWPYDIYAFADVVPVLASAGFRVIAPWLRGYGTTRFLASDTFRNAQQSAVAVDIVALMDALHIERAIVAGFDWGDAIHMPSASRRRAQWGAQSGACRCEPQDDDRARLPSHVRKAIFADGRCAPWWTARRAQLPNKRASDAHREGSRCSR